MSNLATIEQGRPGVIDGLAKHYDMDKAHFLTVMKATIMKGANVSNEDIAAFCLVAKEHGLNPFTKEIFAFPTGGGIQPIVSVDGWMKLINSHPDFDGMEFEDTLDKDGKITAITCKMFRKGRAHPVSVTEYMAECFRQTPTWKQWPARMLRHKTAIQAARYCFGFAGIMEPDEAERMQSVTVVNADIVPAAQITDARQQRCNDAYEQYADSVDLIKECIGRWETSQDPDELYTVAEVWSGIPQAAQMDLWLAPTKGGIFTTFERNTIKSNLPKDDAKETA